MNQGPLIQPFLHSAPLAESTTTNSFQSICIPVKAFKQFKFRNVNKLELEKALTDRSKLSEDLSKLIWQWIREAKASPEAVAVSSDRQIPILNSYGRRTRRVFQRNTAVHIPIQLSEIQIVGSQWRQVRKVVRIGLLSKILQNKHNYLPVKLETLRNYNENMASARQLSDDERSALIELKHFNLKSNVYLLLNRRRVGLKYLPNGSRAWDWYSSTSSKTMLEVLCFISVDVDGRDLKKRFPHLSDRDIAERIAANIQKLPLKPDVVVATGSHLSFHFHWSIKAEQFSRLLSSPDKTREMMAKRVQFALVNLIEGDQRAKGINRPWRCPGTYNFKSKDGGVRVARYCVGSRTFEDAFKHPKYGLEELFAAYVSQDNVTVNRPSYEAIGTAKTTQKVDFFSKIGQGCEDKFESVIDGERFRSLSEIQRHNIRTIFKHIYQFRHRPDAITFQKNGVLREIRGKFRPYPPFHYAMKILNELTTKPLIAKAKDAKWRSNPKKSKATEYALTEYGRHILGSNPIGKQDVQSVLETLYSDGERHNGLNADAITLFRSNWTKDKIIEALKEKNRISAECENGCDYDEADLLHQVDRAESFVKNFRKKPV